MLCAGCTWADTASGKADILRQLTESSTLHLPARAAGFAQRSPDEVAQLGLDLIVYNWASRLSNLPTDVKNIDLIVPAIAKARKRQILNWAAAYFATAPGAGSETPLPVQAEDPVTDLMELKAQIEAAAENRESSPVQAVNALQSAARLCQKLCLDISLALISKELGDHYQYDMTRARQAEAFYDQAAWNFRVYRCTASEAIVHDDWGNLKVAMGRYSQAAEHYTQAAQRWEQLANQDPRKLKHRDMAGLEYIKAGEAKDASGDSAKALELMNTYGLRQLRNWAYPTKSYEVIIKNLIKVAAFMRDRRKDAAGALVLLKEAQEPAGRHGDLLLAARLYDELAKTYILVNQPSNQSAAILKRGKSLNDAGIAGEAALNRCDREPSLSHGTRLELLLAAERGARAYQELKQYAKAAECWRRAAGAYGKLDLVEQQVVCLRALASALDALGKGEEAFQARLDAVAIARSTDRNALAADVVLVDLIQAFREMNETQNAIEGFNELAFIVMASGNSRQIAGVLRARGSLLASQGHHSEAIDDFRKSLETYLNKVGDIWTAAELALELAGAQRSGNRHDDAQATLEAALGISETTYTFESSTAGANNDHSRIVMALYGELAAGYIRAGGHDQANKLIRRAWRYPWLSELMSELRNSRDPAIAQFARNNEILREDPDPPEPFGVQKLLAEDAPGFAKACWKLEQNYASSYSLMPVDPLEVLRLRANLPKDTLVIGYLPTESSVYAFICGREVSICRQLGRGSVDSAVSQLRRRLGYAEQSLSAGVPVPPVAGWQSTSFLEFKEPLSEIHAHLIAPIRADIEKARRLVFLLPREFAALPMHALISGGENGKPRFLVQDFEVTYLTKGMLSSLASTDAREINPATDYLAIFADPEDNLPGARRESEAVNSAYFRSRAYVGSENATAANFLTECGQASIVHVAAHHKIDSSPAGFELLLAQDESSGGSVGIQELMGVRNLATELVVLAACDSVGSADPLTSGPAQAVETFSLAGAKSVLGGLWKVSDEAAAMLMAEFYRNLNRGRSRGEALQIAQLSVIESKQFAHPFYWACFALYGNPR